MSECESLAATYCLGYVDPSPEPRSGGCYSRLRGLLGDGTDPDAHKDRPLVVDKDLLSSPDVVPRVCIHNASAALRAGRTGLAQVRLWADCCLSTRVYVHVRRHLRTVSCQDTVLMRFFVCVMMSCVCHRRVLRVASDVGHHVRYHRTGHTQ